MARKTRNLAKTAVALAATALVEKAIQKASEDPRIRRKAKAIGRNLKKRAKSAGRRIAKAVKKSAPKARRHAGAARSTAKSKARKR